MASQHVWSFNTKSFRISLDCEPDHDCDLSFDDTGELRARIDSGDLQCVEFCLSIRLKGGPEVASSHLCGSIYADVRDFRKEHIGARGRYGSYFRDMVREACSEARIEVSRLRSTLPVMRGEG